MCQHDGCERRFYAVKRREEHEKTVHEGKGLKCDHCEKTFVTSAKIIKFGTNRAPYLKNQ